MVLTGWIHRKPGIYGEQIIIEVTHNRTGRDYDLAVRVGSPSHRKLFKQLGANEQKWKGELKLGFEKYEGRAYVAIKAVNSEDAPF